MPEAIGESWLTDRRRVEIEKARAVIVPFGKHKGKTIGYVFDHEPRHLEWLFSVTYKAEVRVALEIILKYYGESIERARREHERDRLFLLR